MHNNASIYHDVCVYQSDFLCVSQRAECSCRLPGCTEDKTDGWKDRGVGGQKEDWENKAADRGMNMHHL